MGKEFTIDWHKIKVIIFDVDGTLYNQSMLRKKMFRALLGYYVWRPWRLKEILMLHHFRQEREKRINDVCNDLENAQYTWCAEKGPYPITTIRKVVDRWMFQFPLRYLSGCQYEGVSALFSALMQQNVKIAIYSDYPAGDKLKAMNLAADLIVSSTDTAIDRLKPDPRGLLYIARQLEVPVDACLFIGDRPELDGVCAQNAGMPYLILNKDPNQAKSFYQNLRQEFLMNKNLQYTL